MFRLRSLVPLGTGLLLLALFLATALMPKLSLAAAPETPEALFVVTAFFDAPDAVPGDGVCDIGGGLCTLRAAVMEANALPGPDVIDIGSIGPGVFTLTIGGAGEDAATTGDLDITCTVPCPGPGDGLMIFGGGAFATFIDATPLGDRAFHIIAGPAPAPYIVDFMDLTIFGGVAAPPPPGPIGGGILNDGVLTLRRVSLERNSASSGGGLHDFGETLIVDSRVVSNTASVFDGGGVNNAGGPLTIKRTLMADNRALVLGGALYNSSSPVLIASSILRANSTFGGGGVGEGAGGIYHFFGGMLSIHDSTINRNTTPGMLGGGGLLTTGGATTSIISSTISNNTAIDPAGGVGVGGGIRNDGGLDMRNSAVLSNFSDGSGGGLYSEAPATIVNTTLNGNIAGPSSDGHAIYTAASSTLITHTTIAFNGPPAAAPSGALASVSVMEVAGSIVAGNTATNCSTTASAITSKNYNLEDTGGPPASCGFALGGDAVGSALLGPLALNGGPTMNHFPAVGSAAINTGPPPVLGPEQLITLCPPPADDQRFATRPVGGRCDKGSVETPTATAVELQTPVATAQEAAIPAALILVIALGTLVALRRRRTG